MPTQSTVATLYTLAETAINVAVAGSPVSITAGQVRADIAIDFAQVTTTAPASGTRLILQASDTTTEEHWRDLIAFTTGTTAASDEAVSGTEAIGQTVLSVASTTGFGARTEDIYIRSSATVGEWCRLISIVSNTSVTVLDPITIAATGGTIYDQAQRFVAQIDTSCVKRLRLVVDNNTQATGPTVAVQARYITYAN